MTDRFWPQPPASPPLIPSARYRVAAEDFRVEEMASWSADGAGEHDVLWIEKSSANTRWVVGELARYAGCHERDVSYAGLKDRHAVTRQWFSVHRPGREIDWSAFSHPDIRILEQHAHSRKIRIGALRGNRFRIVLRDAGCEPGALEQRVDALRGRGFPNYFGAQRFGREHNNIALARSLAAGKRLRRNQRGFALSAARAAIFNEVLAQRVNRGDWWYPIAGDAVMLADSQSFFPVDGEAQADELRDRAESCDLHPSGPLCGRGDAPSSAAVLALEQDVASQRADLAEAAERGGARHQRRALRCVVGDLTATLSGNDVTLAFTLPAGSFATALLNEFVAELVDASVAQ